MRWEDFVPVEFSLQAAAGLRRRTNHTKFMKFLVVATNVIGRYISRKQADHVWASFGEGDEIKERAVWTCIVLARAVFYWAGTGCFQEFMRRLGRKDLKTAFEEVGAATYFSLHGWGVYARPESGTKQEDFDFQITNGNHKLNVEVAALQSEENTDKVVQISSEKNVNNCLQASRVSSTAFYLPNAGAGSAMWA